MVLAKISNAQHQAVTRCQRSNSGLCLVLPVLMVGIGIIVPAAAQPILPQGSPVERMTPPVPLVTAPATGPVALPPPSSEVPDRPVWVASVMIEGVTAFPAAEIERLSADLVGPAVPLPKIDAARQAILQHYRSAGYALTTVSAKRDSAGALRLIVIEGKIVSVKLQGDIGPAGTQVLRFLNRLTDPDNQPIRSDRLERYLLLAQDVPGVTLRAVLQPSGDQTGSMNLIAQVNRTAVSGSIAFDNRTFEQTGPVQGLLAMNLNSFTEFGERTEFSFYHTFANSQNFGQISTEMFIGSSGLRMKIYAGRGELQPDGSLAAGGYAGSTTIFGTQFTYPVLRSRQQTLNVFAAFDALESEIDTGKPTLVRGSFDSLRVVRLGEDYALSDTWLGTELSGYNTLSFKVSEGLRLLGAGTTGTAPGSPRQHERSDFTKFTFEASRTQSLFTPWDGASVALMGLITGQWTDDILPPAEQFYLGGLRFTRGYYSGQVPGDKALAATVELQLNTSFDLPLIRTDDAIATQFYIFYDWGETWQNQGSDSKTKVASAGGGTRLQITRHAELDLEALERFNRFPTGGASTGVSGLKDVGLYWRLVGRF